MRSCFEGLKGDVRYEARLHQAACATYSCENRRKSASWLVERFAYIR